MFHDIQRSNNTNYTWFKEDEDGKIGMDLQNGTWHHIYYDNDNK